MLAVPRRPRLVNQREVAAQVLGVAFGDLHASGVGGHDDQVVRVRRWPCR